MVSLCLGGVPEETPRGGHCFFVEFELLQLEMDHVGCKNKQFRCVLWALGRLSACAKAVGLALGVCRRAD